MDAINNNNDGEQNFLWFSDFHFDPHYSTSQAFASSYNTDGNCRDDGAPLLGGYGCDSPRGLVSATLEHAVNLTSAKTSSSPAFVIVSGDSIRHGVDQLFAGGDFHEGSEAREARNESNSTTTFTSNSHSVAVEQAANSEYHTRAMEKAGEILHELVTMVQVAFPESEVIVSLGNNDVVPDYYLQLMADDEGIPLGTPETAGMLGVIYNALSRQDANDNATTTLTEEQRIEGGSSKTKTVLTTDDKRTFLRGGYYSRTFHNDTLTVLSLNTVLYSGYFEPTPSNENGDSDDDPGRQFSWMRTVLGNCRERGTQAMIVGHIPPAVGSFRHTQLWKDAYIQTYYEIVKEFDNVITAQLFGHLHSDEFRVGLADYEGGSDSTTNYSMIPSMNTPILLGPSITPLHGNDPSFRLVKYDRGGGGGIDDGKYRILDYDSHRFSFGTSHWSKFYTFSKAYNMASDMIKEEGLTSKAFRTIVKSMDDKRGRESPVLKSYRSYMLSGADGNVANRGRGANTKCDSKCRDEFMCTFQSATRTGYDDCLLERKHSWRKDGRSIFGLVGAVVCGIVVLAFAIVRCRKRSRRDDYESTPSVTGNGQNEDIGARDQEMI